MKKQRTSLRKRVTRGLAGAVYAGIVTATSVIGGGYAVSEAQAGLFGNYGSSDNSREVAKEFENAVVKPGCKYYVTGARKQTSPDVILVLSEDYTLGNPESWKEITPDSKMLEELVGNMKNTASASYSSPSGANVLTHKGIDIGDLYYNEPVTTIKMKDGKRVVIYAPMTGGMGTGTGSTGGGSTGGGDGGGSSG